MSIKIKRINARKVVFSYFYARLKNQDIFENIENLNIYDIDDSNNEKNKIIFMKDKYNLSEEEINILKDFYINENENIDIYVNKMTDNSFLDDIEYIINNFFGKEKENDLIDIDYVKLIGQKYPLYKEEVEKIVNNYLPKFKFSELDYVDKAIFMLGYIESKILATPKKIIQNEMVELAKRYGDEGSEKLINAVFYKIFG